MFFHGDFTLFQFQMLLLLGFFPNKKCQIQTQRPRALGDAEMRGVAAAALRVDAPHYPVIAPRLLKDRRQIQLLKRSDNTKTPITGKGNHSYIPFI